MSRAMPRQKVDRERRARHRRILDHDRDVDGVGDDAIELEDGFLGDPEGRAVIGRHDHHHGGARLPGPDGCARHRSTS